MIIEIQKDTIYTSNPPQWKIYYKEDSELYFNELFIYYDILKLLLEQYGYETNNFGISVENIKQNVKL